MSEPKQVVSLAAPADTMIRSRRAVTLGSADKAKQARRVTQAVSVAYNAARGLSELMAMIVRDVDLLPVNEREAVRRANIAALDAFSRLNSIIIDEGNVERRDYERLPGEE